MKSEIEILQRALQRQKASRKQAEGILEDKSRELFQLTEELQKANRQLKEGLTESTTELQGVFDNLVDAYVLMDISGWVIKMNNAATELFGHDIKNEKINIVTLIYKEDYVYAMDSFKQLIHNGSFSDYQARVYTKNKGIRTVHINASLILDDQQKPVAAQGIVRDITEKLESEKHRQQLLNTLAKSNQELKDFAHIVSHDLKSPLRSINALVNWLKNDYTEVLEGDGLNNIKLIEQTLEKMEQLINGILSYSSAGNKDALKEQQIDINTTIDDIRKTIFIPSHIKIHTKKTLPIITGDKTKIRQLFQNLISNAVEYIDKDQGIIEVDVEDKKSHYLFSIKDNGIGIEKEYHEKVFKIFQSLGDTKNSTGIGLSIVRKIVDLYEGEIWLESELKKGTTVFFSLKKQSI
ncbi:hypothetical protein GCM10022393_24390 [Aquimarina addita]|uniref:histidine kinase n=1 Tax=Aquimarina addita TaxID=870485 RepID=A0ABP6UKH0_9FLAO